MLLPIHLANKLLTNLTSSEETIFHINDFQILEFTSEIGTEYFLLYKNFANKSDAKNYCSNFLPKIDKCLIIDATKF